MHYVSCALSWSSSLAYLLRCYPNWATANLLRWETFQPGRCGEAHRFWRIPAPIQKKSLLVSLNVLRNFQTCVCLLYLWISVCFSHPGMMIPPLNIHQVPNIAASMGPPAALGPSAPLGISGDFCWRHRGFLGHQLGDLRRLIWFDHWS